MNKDKNLFKKALLPVLAFALLGLVIFSGLHILESTVFNKENPEQNPQSSEAEENTGYFPRQDVTTLLLIGVDSMDKKTDSGMHLNEDNADVVSLVIFDEKNECVNVIAFNRDSMVDMPVLDFMGNEAGTVYGQLALSHNYGNGLEASCENVVRTVEMLLGVEIDYYASLNMGGISSLNDAVGGVKVNVTDDFSAIDPSITKGEVTLMGDSALNFIRSRKDLGDQLNISRMERHKEYAKGFMEALLAKMKDSSSFATRLLDATDGYLVTNCSGNTLMSMANRYENYSLNEIVSPKGNNVLGEKYYEFYIDEMDLETIVIKYLYTEKMN